MASKAKPLIAAAVSMVCVASALAADRPAPNPTRNAYFGAVHVHTGYSFDALTNGTITKPSDAYEWAQGKPIPASKLEPDKLMKIVTPLDFYAVSDHAEFMGVFNKMADPNDPLSKTDLARRITSSDPNTAMQAFADVLRDMSTGKTDPMLTDPAVSRSVWAEIVKTADAYYRPGSFTTFPAFEWTSNPSKRNLHRVVVFRDSKHLPDLVLSALDTEKPEDLWAWMQVQRKNGSTLLAIPHNANASDGLMFSLTDSSGKPLSAAYNAERARNEPLYEISQIKGTSETTPSLRRTTSSRASNCGITRCPRMPSGRRTAKAATCVARCSTGYCCHRGARETRSSTASSATRTRTTRQPRTKSLITRASSASNPMPGTA